MNYRIGFISNSSSSSFVIDKKGLTKEQVKQIEEWVEESYVDTDSDNPKYSDDNCITILDKHIYGQVSYHVGFFDFLDEIKVPKKNIDSGD